MQKREKAAYWRHQLQTIPLAYVSFALIWVLVGNLFLYRSSISLPAAWSIYYVKEIGFILGTALLLEYLITREKTRLDALNRSRLDALSQAHAVLLETQQLARIGSWKLCLQTMQVYGSPEAFILLGLEPTQEGIPYDSLVQLFREAKGEGDFSVFTRLPTEGLDTEYIVHLPNGERRAVHVRGSLVYNRNGRPVRLAGTAQDITERWRMEQQLKESEQRFRRIFDLAPVGISEFRPDGTILSANPALRRIIGLQSESLLHKNIRDFSVDEDMAVEQQRLRECAEQGAKSYTLEKRVINADGKSTWTRKTVEVVRDSDGKIDHFLAVMTDITEAKHVQAMLSELNQVLELRVNERTQELNEANARLMRYTEDLATANQELESFSYSVSHDLRAPLRAISGFAEILQRRYSVNLPQEGQHYLNNVTVSAERMAALIDDLLNYSRVARREADPSPVGVRGLLENICRDLQAQIDATAAQIDLPAENCVVNANPTLLKQILTNLLANALTYITPGGAPRVQVTVDVGDDETRIRVTDNGIGIPAEHHEKIFDIFQRLHQVEEYPGTGIGLAIVKKAVSRMGGGVTVESKPGEGACFIVRIPDKAGAHV